MFSTIPDNYLIYFNHNLIVHNVNSNFVVSFLEEILLIVC